MNDKHRLTILLVCIMISCLLSLIMICPKFSNTFYNYCDTLDVKDHSHLNTPLIIILVIENG